MARPPSFQGGELPGAMPAGGKGIGFPPVAGQIVNNLLLSGYSPIVTILRRML